MDLIIVQTRYITKLRINIIKYELLQQVMDADGGGSVDFKEFATVTPEPQLS